MRDKKLHRGALSKSTLFSGVYQTFFTSKSKGNTNERKREKSKSTGFRNLFSLKLNG